MSLARIAAPALALTLSALLTTACTDADEPRGPRTSQASATPDASVSISTAPSGRATADPQGAIDLLKDWTCEIRKGRWAATGRFDNPGAQPITLTLAVAVVKSATREIVEESRHRVTVPAAGSATVDLPDVGPGSQGTVCTRWAIG